MSLSMSGHRPACLASSTKPNNDKQNVNKGQDTCGKNVRSRPRLLLSSKCHHQFKKHDVAKENATLQWQNTATCSIQSQGSRFSQPSWPNTHRLAKSLSIKPHDNVSHRPEADVKDVSETKIAPEFLWCSMFLQHISQSHFYAQKLRKIRQIMSSPTNNNPAACNTPPLA